MNFNFSVAPCAAAAAKRAIFVPKSIGGRFSNHIHSGRTMQNVLGRCSSGKTTLCRRMRRGLHGLHSPKSSRWQRTSFLCVCVWPCDVNARHSRTMTTIRSTIKTTHTTHTSHSYSLRAELNAFKLPMATNRCTFRTIAEPTLETHTPKKKRDRRELELRSVRQLKHTHTHSSGRA